MGLLFTQNYIRMRNIWRLSFEELNTIREKILIISLAYLALAASFAMAHGDTSLASPSVRTLFIYSQYVAIFLICIFTSWRKLHASSLLILIPTFTYYIFYLFDSSPLLSVPINFVIVFPLILIAFQSTQILTSAYRILYKCFVLMSILGIIASVSFIFNLGIPYEIVPYYFGDDYYVNYHFAYFYWGGQEGLTFRLCGLCNEPGPYGTILALLLIVQKIDIKKIGNIILLIAGFFTFSAAFYAIIFIYLSIVSLRKVLLWLPIVLTILLLIINIPNIEMELPMLSRLIERFEFDNKTGKFKGDNRTSMYFDKAYDKLFESTHNALLGLGTNSNYKIQNAMTESYKVFIYQYGIIGFVLIYFSFFIIRADKWLSNRNVLYFTLLLLVSIYQKPRIFMATYFLLYYGGIDYIIHTSRRNYYLIVQRKG